MNSVETLAAIASFTGQSNLFDTDKTETKLIRAIESHKNRIQTIEKASGPSRRTQFLREEVARLKVELDMEIKIGLGNYR